MTHCRECNSEIAEAEAFCPFCGISLEQFEPNDESGEVPPDDEVGMELDSSELKKEKLPAGADLNLGATIVASPSELFGSEAKNDDDSGFVDIADLKEEASEEADEKAASPAAGTGDMAAAPAREISEIETAGGDLADSSLITDDGESLIAADDEEIERAVDEIDIKAEVWLGDEADGEAGSSDKQGDVDDLAAAQESVLDSVLEVNPEEPIEEVVELSEVDLTLDSESEQVDSAKEVDEDSAIPDPPKLIQEELSAAATPEAAEPQDEKSEVGDQSLEAVDDKVVSVPGSVSEMDSSVTEEAERAEDVVAASDFSDENESSAPVKVVETVEAKAEVVEVELPVIDAGQEDEVSQLSATSNDELQGDAEPADSASAIAAEPDLPVAEFVPESNVEGEADAAQAAESPDSSDSPQTTPNIGVSDTDGSNTPKLRPLNEGIVLNSRYEIVRKIGGGGMGAVYLASDKNLGGVLRAVKEMVQSYIEREQQEKAVQDFKRESMLLTSLEHPSIPTIYDYFFDEQEGRFYLVMKYISGGDLAARLRAAPEGRLDEISVTEWAVQISDVLSYLHNRQPPIVYRDLKPANVMIDGNSSKVMLIDFGIARWINKEEKGVTAVGTMGYAPPELFSGNVVPSSDIYSLGSTMFHLLTGADPQNNPLLIFDFQKHPRPRQINPNLSDQMERILMRSVEYNADGRFGSASEMNQELKLHLQNLKGGGVSYGITESPKPIALSDQPVFCGFCGQKIVATDMFCAFCGAKQPLAQPGVQSQEYFIPQSTARLMVEGTGDLNLPTFEIGKRENLVGRRDPMSNIFPEVDLSKFDPQTKVSRKHARIWRDGEAYMLEDLGSSNGTLIISAGADSSRLLPHTAQKLNNGDKIQVGDTVLHFVLG